MMTSPSKNIYFELTEELNAEGLVAVLASGQAVVYYKIAMMSKDGDWILKETPEACQRVLETLGRRGARYRSGAPLDVRWLAGGWSSHLEFNDPEGRRIRCDFLTRPPRVRQEDVARLFEEKTGASLLVVGLEPLIRMKQTQRAKDYPVIGELARLLPPEREIEWTTDPDRILELAPVHGGSSRRPPVRVARAGGSRVDVVVELARELDRLQQQDRKRVEKYRMAAEPFTREFLAARIGDMELAEAHTLICQLAERWLPFAPLGTEDAHGAPQ